MIGLKRTLIPFQWSIVCFLTPLHWGEIIFLSQTHLFCPSCQVSPLMVNSSLLWSKLRDWTSINKRPLSSILPPNCPRKRNRQVRVYRRRFIGPYLMNLVVKWRRSTWGLVSGFCSCWVMVFWWFFD